MPSRLLTSSSLHLSLCICGILISNGDGVDSGTVSITASPHYVRQGTEPLTFVVPYNKTLSLTCSRPFQDGQGHLYWYLKTDSKNTFPYCNGDNSDVCYRDMSNNTHRRIVLFFLHGVLDSSVNMYECGILTTSSHGSSFRGTAGVQMLVKDIPKAPPIIIPSKRQNETIYFGRDLITCKFNYSATIYSEWSNVTLLWTRELSHEEIPLGKPRELELHQYQASDRQRVTLFIPQDKLIDYQGTYQCYASSPYYLKRVKMKTLHVIFNGSATATTGSVTVQPTFSDSAAASATATTGSATVERTSTTSTTYIIIATVVPLVVVCIIVLLLVCLVRVRGHPQWPWKHFFSDMTVRIPGSSRWSRNGSRKSDMKRGRQLMIPRENIRIQKTIGEGYFGLVLEAEIFGIEGHNKWTRAAIKTMKNNEKGPAAAALLGEATLMSKIGPHENIVRLLAVCIDRGSPLIVMEYSEYGNLRSHLMSKRTEGPGYTHSCPANDAFVYALQVAKGMAYMASHRCIHRDLSARNVLVFSNELLKVSDFGLSKEIQYHDYYRRKCPGILPLKWTAPEALIDKKYTEFSDVWSFGILLWEIATMGGSPYPGIPIETLYDLLTSSCYRMTSPPNCPDRLYNLMISCWDSTPSSRPRFSALVDLINEELAQLQESDVPCPSKKRTFTDVD